MSQQRDWRPFTLLLIDVQEDFWPAETAAAFPNFPQNVARLLTLCRDEGLDVVHLRAQFSADRSDWMVRYKLRDWIPCVEGTDGADLLPSAAPHPGEPVFHKQTFDGFLNPALPRYLESHNKRFVLVAGLVTSICVLLTAMSAAQRGYLTALVTDCCADDPAAHAHTLQNYPFAFENVTHDQLVARLDGWHDALANLETG